MALSITDYASLQSAVADYLNRTDLTTRIPDFIGLAETWMMRKVRSRLMEVEVTTTAPSGARELTLPTDYREPLNFWWSNGTDRDPLRFVPPALLDVFTTPGRPVQWTVDGANIGFERPCDQAYPFVFRYIQKLALSEDDDTNNLLTQYPDIYLAATMVEAAPFLKDADALTMWLAKRGSLSHDIREEEERQKALVTLSTEPALLIRRGRGGFNAYRGY